MKCLMENFDSNVSYLDFFPSSNFTLTMKLMFPIIYTSQFLLFSNIMVKKGCFKGDNWLFVFSIYLFLHSWISKY